MAQCHYNGAIEIGQLWYEGPWFVDCRHQAITSTNVDLSSVKSYGIHAPESKWKYSTYPLLKYVAKLHIQDYRYTSQVAI